MELPDPIALRRRAQMFPTLTDDEMARACRFGEAIAFPGGEPLVTAGTAARGLYLLRLGRVRVSRRDGLGGTVTLAEHGPGAFVAEVGALSGRAALVDAHALEPVEAVALPPERLRALIGAEAALGERIMRSLILRRSSLIETGDGGPLFIGPAASPDIARLASFVSRNGLPHRVLSLLPPAGPGCSPSATCAPDRSSASAAPSARARPSRRRSTGTSP